MEPPWNTNDNNPMALAENAPSGATLGVGRRWERVVGLTLWGLLLGVLLWLGAS